MTFTGSGSDKRVGKVVKNFERRVIAARPIGGVRRAACRLEREWGVRGLGGQRLEFHHCHRHRERCGDTDVTNLIAAKRTGVGWLVELDADSSWR